MPPKGNKPQKPTAPPTPNDSLLTKKTSPMLVKQAFTKIQKLFDALSAEMTKPLPGNIKAELLDHAVCSFIRYLTS